jgi:hypothetical protein
VLVFAAYGLVCAADALWQLIDPDPDFSPINASFCKYYHFTTPIQSGKRARIEIDNNEEPGPKYGAVDIYVTPPGNPLPPAGNPAPRTTYCGNGETTVNGPGTLTIHLKQTHHRQRFGSGWNNRPGT